MKKQKDEKTSKKKEAKKTVVKKRGDQRTETRNLRLDRGITSLRLETKERGSPH